MLRSTRRSAGRGHQVTELPRKRLGDDAALHLVDLGSPLPFPDAAFDDIVAITVLRC
ncbi:hypothetical protein [Streptomyces pulveraceus]|uniref:Methyltransferase type 11 domain-containing protein n=1 Tax=Streptomyces pulveraceus TaxID=68258 RepID=A0ABW1GMP2_9ACTN